MSKKSTEKAERPAKKHTVRNVLIAFLVILVVVGAISTEGTRNQQDDAEEPSVESVQNPSAAEEPEDDATEEQPDRSYTGPVVIESNEPIAPEAFSKLQYGNLISVVNNGYGTIVIKAKISPSYSNKATVDQNYFNVCDFIESVDLSGIDEVQYWAVADMTNGNEQKVISFTVDRETIDAIIDGKVPAATLGERAVDLWVLPSLLG